jgi:asparagine N-glycosylation enzyme membrane subunit Stt3
MWNTDTLWFEITVVSILFLLGNIFLGHFEERSPNWRKLVKYIVTVIIIVSISIFVGRAYAFTLLGLFVIPVIYIHGIVLPKKGINGWTGEPKSKYYDFRGWSKDIFNCEERKKDAEL